MAETWTPPEAEQKDSWQPPEASSWTPPEASAPKVSPALMTLGKALGYVQDLGKEAFSGILPTETMQMLFGGSESSLRPEERSKPLISPAASKEIIGQLPSWAGGETPFAQGAAGSISGALSEFSKPSAIAQIPTFLVPGVAETYAANVLAGLPKQYDKLRETIQIHGLASKETGAVAAESGIQDLMGFLALKGGAMARNVKPTLSETLFPTKPTPEEVINHAQEPNTAPNTVLAVESQPVVEAAKGEVQTRDKGNAPPQEITPNIPGEPIEQAPKAEVLRPEPPVAAEVQPAEAAQAAPPTESPGLRAINEEGGLQLNKGNEVSGFIVPNEKGYSLVGPDGILKPEEGEQFDTAAEALNAATSRGMEIDPRVISEYGQSNATPEPRVLREAAREGATPASQEPSAPVSPSEEEKARKFRGPADSFGSEVTPVAAHIINDIGGLMSKSTAKANGLYQKNPDLWDGAPALDHPTHNKVYGATGETPDVAAQSAYEEGLISEPTPDALYDAIKKESHTARTIQSEERAQRDEANRAVPNLKSTEEAVAHGESGTADIPALNAKRDQLLGEAEKATGNEKVGLITQAQLYREASETATKAAAASPETETQPQSPTGIRNAIVDKQRVDRGLPERMAPLRKTNPEAWDAAMTKIDENPNAGRELIANIKNDQRALKPEESALLAHETVTRENAFDSAIENVNSAKTPEDLAQAKQRLDLARNDIQELYDVGQRTGTESGQSLQARKMLVSQDYSLAKMEATKRAISNDGKPLSEKQLAEVKDLHDQLTALREKIEAADNAKSQEKQMAIYRQLVKESLTGTKEIAKQGGTLQTALDSAAAKARERIIARRGRLQVTVDPLNVAGLVDEAIIGASHIARGITKFSDWSAQMLKDFGERISPYLKDLWDRARQYHDAHAKLFEKGGDETPQSALSKISANAAEGKELNQKQVFDLARAHVNAGVEGLDNVIRQVTSDLQESHPGITEREVRDTFSGYGETKLPSKEADLAALRDYRRQAQLVSALEDAQKGEAPLKSGMQRDKPSDTVRELQRQVVEAMREHGIETTDPEQQLASNLQRYKTSLKNRTTDLEKKIAAGDYTKPSRTETRLDDEAMKAKAAYERVRQKFETGLEKDRQAKRPAWQKTLEQIAGTARASALSGYHTLAKLATYDLAKLVEIPLTEIAGGLISKIPGMRGISAKANLESGSTIRPIVDFYVGAATKGMKEAWNVLRTGKTESKVLYGKPDYSPPKWYDFFGNLHMAEKAPLLTGTMKMYLRRATENAIKAGLDPSNEFTKAAINKAVYDHSQKSILQENNKFAEAVNGLQARMEAVNPKTGQVDVTNAVISTLVKTFLTKGIVRTPANYFAQTIARTPVGLATGLVKAGMAHYRGIGNLHPIEANAISALIKTGAVGSAFFILGAIDGTKEEKDRTFGGYWEPGRKRGGDDVPWGKIRISGMTFPHLMTHNPLTESAQMGSTMMRVALSRFRKKDEDTQGIVKGAVKAIVGLAGKAPVASPVMRLGEDRTNVVADLLKGLVPQLIQNLAEDIDSGVQRAPQTTGEEIKTAIPGLRETVPVKEEKKQAQGFSIRSRQ